VLNAAVDFRIVPLDEYCASQQPTIFVANRPNPILFNRKNVHPKATNSTMESLMKTMKTVRDMPIDRQPRLEDITVCRVNFTSPITTCVGVNGDMSKFAAGNEKSEIVLWDFDLASPLQYYSSRVVRHWRRVPVRRVVSEADFQFVDPRIPGLFLPVLTF